MQTKWEVAGIHRYYEDISAGRAVKIQGLKRRTKRLKGSSDATLPGLRQSKISERGEERSDRLGSIIPRPLLDAASSTFLRKSVTNGIIPADKRNFPAWRISWDILTFGVDRFWYFLYTFWRSNFLIDCSGTTVNRMNRNYLACRINCRINTCIMFGAVWFEMQFQAEFDLWQKV